MKNFYKGLALTTALMCLSSNAMSSTLDVFSGWTVVTNDEGMTQGPGVGGQLFDAEYLLYKKEGNLLSIGLQTGFDISTGHVYYSGKHYYAGDLALSFDGDASNYEYAVDFGKYTEDYQKNDGNPNNNGLTGDKVGGSGTGTDAAGLYKNISWNNDIAFLTSSPFAMGNGTKVIDLLGDNNQTGYADGEKSYYRIITLNLLTLSDLLGTDLVTTGFTLDMHWTMSCGNDEIEGSTPIPASPVPEPATMLLFGTGIAGLAGMIRRRRTNS